MLRTILENGLRVSVEESVICKAVFEYGVYDKLAFYFRFGYIFNY